MKTSSWRITHRANRQALALANGNNGKRTYAPPGRCVVLLSGDSDKEALWVSSWPKSAYVKQDIPGAWTCSFFRNESSELSSNLILEALAVTRHIWGNPPPDGMETLMDPEKVNCNGYNADCFIEAGFELKHGAKNGRIVFQIGPDDIPAPRYPRHEQLIIPFSQSLTEEERWGRAISWVNTKKNLLTNWARSRMNMSGYDREDFIQQAYLSAYNALSSREIEKDPALFERYFWGVFKIQCFKMVVNPRVDNDFPVDIPNDFDKADFEVQVKSSLIIMAPRERDVWCHLLGEEGHVHTLSEVGEKLGCSRQRIGQIRDAGLRRVREYFLANEKN